MKNDMKIDLDNWENHCPICEMIVKEEEWPRKIECGEISSPEVQRGEKHPPCIMCDSKELTEFYLTVPTADNKSVTHTRLIRCDSCGSGQYFEGMDAASNRPKVIYKYPPELERDKIVKELEEALANGEQNDDLLAKVRFSVAMEAFFRPIQHYCLDKGWDILGYGVRPLERTEIMNQFYVWTNKEAMSEADESDNPLRRDAEHKGKKRKGWRRR